MFLDVQEFESLDTFRPTCNFILQPFAGDNGPYLVAKFA